MEPQCMPHWLPGNMPWVRRLLPPLGACSFGGSPWLIGIIDFVALLGIWHVFTGLRRASSANENSKTPWATAGSWFDSCDPS